MEKATTHLERSEDLAKGLILGAGTTGSLSQAPVLDFGLQTGDSLLAFTHHGHGYKSVNEDRIALVEAREGNDSRAGIFVIDGMGGHQRGDVAAQILSEEVVRALRLDHERLIDESAAILREEVHKQIMRLPDAGLVEGVIAHMAGNARSTSCNPKDLLWSAIEAVQIESIELEGTSAEDLRTIAEVLRALSDLHAPCSVEVALKRTRKRIEELGYKADGPDACFTGAIFRSNGDGTRTLDVKQIGDCKLVVFSGDGAIRFQTIGESMIPEPNLSNPDITLTELMGYSLHRNIVTNSVYSQQRGLKHYRRDDLPIAVHSGDVVLIYSDGVDDLFTPSELIQLLRSRPAEDFMRRLMLYSEQRMKFVSSLVSNHQKRLPPNEQNQAYPAVHQLINRSRLEHGHYAERYADGTVARWTKPPKCDNTSFCMLRIG